MSLSDAFFLLFSLFASHTFICRKFTSLPRKKLRERQKKKMHESRNRGYLGHIESRFRDSCMNFSYLRKILCVKLTAFLYVFRVFGPDEFETILQEWSIGKASGVCISIDIAFERFPRVLRKILGIIWRIGTVESLSCVFFLCTKFEGKST
jgi:hypothetical protein